MRLPRRLAGRVVALFSRISICQVAPVFFWAQRAFDRFGRIFRCDSITAGFPNHPLSRSGRAREIGLPPYPLSWVRSQSSKSKIRFIGPSCFPRQCGNYVQKEVLTIFAPNKTRTIKGFLVSAECLPHSTLHRKGALTTIDWQFNVRTVDDRKDWLK